MFASWPSPLRVRRAAAVMRWEDPRDTNRKSATATTTTTASSGSRTTMTMTMTSSVAVLAKSGSPAVMATSCSRFTSPTMRWTVSALRLRA